VSRSAIVNIDRIREIQTWFNGDYMILLRNGAKVSTTRGYRQRVQELLGKGVS
jgi:two-component system, LytTR family, response regulator